jgi:hypothetical protein
MNRANTTRPDDRTVKTLFLWDFWLDLPFD